MNDRTVGGPFFRVSCYSPQRFTKQSENNKLHTCQSSIVFVQLSYNFSFMNFLCLPISPILNTKEELKLEAVLHSTSLCLKTCIRYQFVLLGRMGRDDSRSKFSGGILSTIVFQCKRRDRWDTIGPATYRKSSGGDVRNYEEVREVQTDSTTVEDNIRCQGPVTQELFFLTVSVF